MANKSQLRCITCWMSLLCAIAIAFACTYGASGLREVRGAVRVGAEPIREIELKIIDAKEAAVRYESRLKAAKSNLAALSEQLRKIIEQRAFIEKDRTAKVYKSMFSETGPADKEQLREEIDALNAALTALNSEEATLRGKVLNWKSPDGFFEGRWTNVLAVARTTGEGKFSVQIPADRDCWLSIRERRENSPASALGWLLPVPLNNAPLTLCETNAILISP